MMWLYSIALLLGIAGLVCIDWRLKLAFFYDARRTISTLVIGIGIFFVWDILGIALGIFRHGNSAYTLPIRLLPEFPPEEIVFLFLLCYVTLLLYQGMRRWRHI